MNAIGYAPPSFRPRPRRRAHRIETVTFASAVSIVALLGATVLHVAFGVSEGPLVIGTIVGASIVGWVNAYLPGADTSAPDDGDPATDPEWYDRAA